MSLCGDGAIIEYFRVSDNVVILKVSRDIDGAYQHIRRSLFVARSSQSPTLVAGLLLPFAQRFYAGVE